MHERGGAIYLGCFRVGSFVSQWCHSPICLPFGVRALWCLWKWADTALVAWRGADRARTTRFLHAVKDSRPGDGECTKDSFSTSQQDNVGSLNNGSFEALPFFLKLFTEKGLGFVLKLREDIYFLNWEFWILETLSSLVSHKEWILIPPVFFVPD